MLSSPEWKQLSQYGEDRVLQYLAERLARTPIVFGGGWDSVTLGNNVRLVNTLLNVSSGIITIGDDTFFGHNVCLLTGHHPIDGSAPRRPAKSEGHDIVIGRNVWIASNVTVIGPCSIGDHAVIAAGSVVTKDVEGNHLYAGVPARRMRKL